MSKTSGELLRVTVGEYTVVQAANGEARLLRKGEEWPAGHADNVHLALAYEVDSLRTKEKAVWNDLIRVVERADVRVSDDDG